MPWLSRFISVSYTKSILILRLNVSKVKVLTVIGVHTTALRPNLLLLVAVRNVIYTQPNAISAVLFHVYPHSVSINGTGLNVS